MKSTKRSIYLYIQPLYHALRVAVTALCIALCVPIASRANAKGLPLPDNLEAKYGKWMTLSVDELVGKGREFLYQKNHPDSALVCFSIAVSRYKDSMSDEEKTAVYQAYTGKWYAQFFHFYDYPKAYESLLEADKISRELGKGRGMTNFNLALMYQVFGVDGHDRETLLKAKEYRKMAFREGMAESDTNVVHMAFSNMALLAADTESLDSLRRELSDYEAFNQNSRNPMTKFNILLYDINRAIADNDYPMAFGLLDRQLAFIGESQPRYTISNLMSRAELHKQLKDYRAAETNLNAAEELARRYEMKDVLLNIYDADMKLYEASGEREKLINAYHLYLSMKDTLINYRQVSGFNQIHFLSEMEKMDATLAQIEYKRHVQFWIMLLCIGVVVVIIGFLLVILRKNRKLRAANTSLYEKHHALLEQEEKSSSTRHSDIVKGKVESADEGKVGIAKEVEESDREKTEAVMARLRIVANDSEEIYSPKFTIAKFAELAGLPTKVVSQVINESTDDNFNAFINRYRIRKACRMLDDIETYGSLTIENIAQSVGFRSRTAFISSFKKSTGLNPSDYLKAARQARKTT